jgi:SET domain-containing protein
MVKYFHFHAPNHQFDEQLKSFTCGHIKPDNTNCKRKVVMGLPLCFQHTESDYKLKVKESTIANAGLGLFAYDKSKGENEVVFTRGQKICPYYGEVIDEPTLMKRYGEYTAPYGIQLNKKMYEDASTMRGIGSLINHKITSQTNCYFSLGKNNRINIVASKNIKNYEQLFINYGREYRFNEPIQYSTNYSKYKV